MKTLAARLLPFIILVVSDTDFHPLFNSNITNYYEITMKAMGGWWIDGQMNWWMGVDRQIDRRAQRSTG